MLADKPFRITRGCGVRPWTIAIALIVGLLIVSGVDARQIRRSDWRHEVIKGHSSEAKEEKTFKGSVTGIVVDIDVDGDSLDLDVVLKRKNKKKRTVEVSFLLSKKTKVVRSRKKKLEDVTEGSKLVVGYTMKESDLNPTAVWIRIVKIPKPKTEKEKAKEEEEAVEDEEVVIKDVEEDDDDDRTDDGADGVVVEEEE